MDSANRRYINAELKANRNYWKNADSGGAKVDKKTKDAIAGIYNGTIAHTIKKNSSYVLTGVAVGVIGSVMLAAVLRKSKLLFALGGALAGGVTGAIMTPKEKNDKK